MLRMVERIGFLICLLTHLRGREGERERGGGGGGGGAEGGRGEMNGETREGR